MGKLRIKIFCPHDSTILVPIKPEDRTRFEGPQAETFEADSLLEFVNKDYWLRIDNPRECRFEVESDD